MGWASASILLAFVREVTSLVILKILFYCAIIAIVNLDWICQTTGVVVQARSIFAKQHAATVSTHELEVMDPFKVRSLIPKIEGAVGRLAEADQGIKRLIRPVYNNHSQAPRYVAMPMTVVFNYPGLRLTHQEIKSAVYERLWVFLSSLLPKDKLWFFYNELYRSDINEPVCKIREIQFIPLASNLNLRSLDNRWLVTLTSEVRPIFWYDRFTAEPT